MVANKRVSLVALLLALGAAPVAGAATFTVNTTADAVDANPGDGVCLTAAGQCSLRAAIQEANALAGADVITLPAGTYNLTIGGQGEDAAAQGDLDITSEIVINGAGADKTIVDGMRNDRVFQVHVGGIATLNALTIQNGYANNNGVGGGLSNRGGVVTLNDCNVYRNAGSGYGGGLDNSSFSDGGNANVMATMTVNRCTISNNTILGNGAGLSNNNGILVINDSTIRDNKSGQFAGNVQGGGIYNSSSMQLPGSVPARLEVNRTLITGHSVMTDGGGIYHLVGNMSITNSTITNNEAKRNGGGIYIANTNSQTSNTILHATITNNSAYALDSSNKYSLGGGGLFNGNPSSTSNPVTTSLQNSLIAANGVGGNCYNIGQLVKQGNFISDDSCINSNETATGVTYSAAQIGLGALADNGGPTQTFALLPGSLAIGTAVSSLCATVDQRGYTRTVSACDAGAYAYTGAAPTTPAVPTPPPSGGVSTDSQNHVPQVFPMPATAVAGTPLHGVLNGVDADGNPLTYKIVTKAIHGSIGLDDLSGSGSNVIPGSYTYLADVGFSGTDSFTYEACDAISCSTPAMISIAVSSGVAANEIGITLVAPGTGTPSPITVVSGPTLTVIAPDTDPSFSYPLGAFFFAVTAIPVDPATQANGTVVTIQLPAGATIAAGAVIRKLDNTGVWRTLGAGPNLYETTGTIDVAARTITLVLRDNDRFDTNPAVGAITDPVAIGVQANPSSSGGGGAVNLLALAGLLAAVAWRRRPH